MSIHNPIKIVVIVGILKKKYYYFKIIIPLVEKSSSWDALEKHPDIL